MDKKTNSIWRYRINYKRYSEASYGFEEELTICDLSISI